MSHKPILVVMAAGIGSRFGGLKQMAPFGLHGESLIDYSLYDALRAGFERVAFIVNKKIKDDFRDIVGKNVENRMEVHYVMQELDKLPKGFTVPPERVKPWGTAHAILCAKDVVDAPFCALNGDDFYGLDAMQQIFNFLNAKPQENQYAMAGFELQNTLSDAGYVSRGECKVNDKGYLDSIVERLHIIPTIDGPMYTLDNEHYTRIPGDTTVSMNMWAFTPGLMDHIEQRFETFYKDAMANNPLKGEFYLPNLVGDLLKEDKVSVKVLRSKDRWFGVTNASDRPLVEKALKDLTDEGTYPEGLWLK
ncbi:MAG: NTP transferase domain-containing protein [Clostridiales bacterium]|nr:NTP transferase domain-containing protein [Clostridiales bacterium]